MLTLRQPFTSLQIELLDLYARGISEQDLLAIKIMLSRFFAQKAIEEADKIWDERGYSDDTMQEWLNTRMRANKN
jgi:hypothetical protein